MNDFNFGRTLLTVALAGLLAGGAGCGKDKNNKDGPIDEANAPQAVTDVDAIVFVEVALNTTDTQAVTILNVGDGDLRITGVQLVEETRDDPGGEEFARGDDWVNSAVLSTNEDLRLSVKYTPTDESPDNGYLLLDTNDPNHPDGLRIDLETPEIAPRIFSRENVIFQRVPPINDETRDKFWQLTEVQNTGQSPLEINQIVLSPDGSDFKISFPQSLDATADPATDGDSFPSQLAAGESFPIRVYFNPLDDLPSSASMIIFSNDPESPDYEVNLIGNSGAPCLQLNFEDEVNFGEGGIGFANNKTVIINNCSPSSELEVSEISVCTLSGGNCDASDPIFQLKEDSLPGDLPDAPAIIDPQDSANFVLTYTPEDLSVSEGELTIKSDDPAKSTLVVPVIGKGTDNSCPQAVAEAKLVDSTRWQTDINTIPLKTVQFRGINSIDQDGTISRYEWNIVQSPTNSTARMNPSADVAEPELFLDLAGDYVIELKVFDDKGTESCGDQALVSIRATPDEDIHVQLVWDTPSDSDQTDENGSDVDLHFRHPNGTWNRPPLDIFWSNPEAEWGALGPDGDPSLDIDDTDGAGPENINLNDPEPSATYAIGAYYYADNGFGPSYATIRIYIRGEQQFEWRDMYLPGAQSFWYVATVEWPSAQILSVNQVQENFPVQ